MVCQFLEPNYLPERRYNHLFTTSPVCKSLKDYDFVFGHRSFPSFKDIVDDQFVKIVVFREPVERIISEYFSILQNKQEFYDEVSKLPNGLEGYIDLGNSQKISSYGNVVPIPRNYYTRYYSMFDEHEANRDPERAVGMAIEAVLGFFDVIGFQEEMDAFCNRVYKKANLRHKYQNQRSNVTHLRKSKSEIPEATLKKIEQNNLLDIEFYRKLRKTVNAPKLAGSDAP